MTISITSLLAAASDHRLRSLTGALADAGHDVEFIDGTWQERFDALRDGSAVAGWLCGLLHVELTAGGDWPYRAVAALPSPRAGSKGAPVYYGDVVVAPHSDVSDFVDLRGSRFAYNETTSLSGYRMMLDLVALHDSDLSFFSETIVTGSHFASMRLVADGTADCAIIDSTLVDDRVEGTDAVRVLVSVGPYPAPPLVTDPEHEALLRSVAISAGWTLLADDAYSMLTASD